MAGFNMSDYVDVAERIREFYERYPEGSLQSGRQPHVVEVGGKPFIVYHALAFRGPDDELPAHGWAWEPVPGPTQFTKDSELMNAETAAWGRAIVAAGFSTKKIASAQEVQARQEPKAAQKSRPVEKPVPDTAEAENVLLALVLAKNGDVEAVKAAIEAERGTPDFVEWVEFQRTWWSEYEAAA